MARDPKLVRAAVEKSCELLLTVDQQFGRTNGTEENFVLTCALNELVWKYSEASPLQPSGTKYLRCETWSEEARKEWESASDKRAVKLIFEHVVPRWKIITMLVDARDMITIKEALSWIRTCVVLRREDDALRRADTELKKKYRNYDPGWPSPDSWWERYKMAGIRWIKIDPSLINFTCNLLPPMNDLGTPDVGVPIETAD